MPGVNECHCSSVMSERIAPSASASACVGVLVADLYVQYHSLAINVSLNRLRIEGTSNHALLASEGVGSTDDKHTRANRIEVEHCNRFTVAVSCRLRLALYLL